MPSNPEIFFSYAWGDESEQGESREKLVNELYESLVNDQYEVVRDKYNLGYKGFISEFMGQIGQGKCIVVPISQKYVRSPYCMFELYEIARNSNFDKHRFREKVLPIMVEFIDFTKPAVIDELFSFWENEYNQWEALVKKRLGQLSVEQLQRYDKIKMIHQHTGKLMDWIIDMNTLNSQILSAGNFSEIKKEIQRIADGIQTNDINAIRKKNEIPAPPPVTAAVTTRRETAPPQVDPQKIQQLRSRYYINNEFDKIIAVFKEIAPQISDSDANLSETLTSLSREWNEIKFKEINGDANLETLKKDFNRRLLACISLLEKELGGSTGVAKPYTINNEGAKIGQLNTGSNVNNNGANFNIS